MTRFLRAWWMSMAVWWVMMIGLLLRRSSWTGSSLSMALGRVLTPGVAEQELEATVHGVPMSGSVDYRDASGVLVDWKTGRVPSDGSRHADQLRAVSADAVCCGCV
ncbi:MAG: hypothetical protein ACLRL4_10860 [Bifidobacterium bifidum]